MHPLFFMIFSFLLLCLETTTTAKLLASVGGGANNGVMKKCSDKERASLLDFKAGLKDPKGCLSTWTAAENDCCRWSRVTCNNQTRHVTELDISYCDVVGEISPSLLNLTNLNGLYLFSNSFHGTIPKFIGSMTQLNYLALFHNSFYGTIPPEFGNLTNLQVLDLGSVGRCRVENLEWLSHLSLLKGLYMDGISLAKQNHWVHVILSLPKLSWLRLDGCELSEVMYPFSSSFLNSSSSSIESLFFQNNSLTSSMYPWLFPLTSNKLTDLDLSSNMLDGIPTYLANLSSLEYLDLSYNQLNGSITDKLWELPTLTSLDLSENDFSGGISFICQFVSGFLELLDLSQNFLHGPIPDCLWHLKELTILRLGNNNLSGRLPPSVKSLIKLEVLDLYNNDFSGEVPLSLQNCTHLSVLNLGANKFSGNVPFWIGDNLSGLYALMLTSNNFFGTIPSHLCQLENLQILDLSNNNLHGTIPSCLNNFTAMLRDGTSETQNQHHFGQDKPLLYTYYEDHAMIGWQGVVREFFSNLRLLKMIDLSSNNLTGQIPSEKTYPTTLYLERFHGRSVR